MSADRRSRLPSVEAVVQAALAEVDGRLEAGPARRWLTALARADLAERRAAGAAVDAGAVASGLAAELGTLAAGRASRVINATGVVLQTNLGRSPLSAEAVRRVAEVAAGYSDLEYDLDTGARGARGTRIGRALVALVGAPAVVVNNNAAALLLALTALARGREVVVSRGELIEVGGSFRLPDVMRLSGARLVEVGTTNRTRISDYETALSSRTALLLKVHPSNYRVTGFTEAVGLRELAALGRRAGVPVLEDLGSGALLPTAAAGLPGEPLVADSIRDGADLVAFSGDKLLGGPQAGIIAGAPQLVRKLARHPLYRTLRPDKLTLAALEATLAAYLRGTAGRDLPVWRALAMSAAETRRRARAWAAAVGDAASVVAIDSAVGGGSLPGATLKGYGLAVGAAGGRPSAATIARRLRAGDPPVVARVSEDRVLLDPRTVLDGEDEALVTVLRAALRAGA